MNTTVLFYQEPENINLKALMQALVLNLFISIVLGYTYTMLITSIPIVYFLLVINIGLGVLLSFIVRLVAKFTHNRNKKNRLILALSTSLMVSYFQWVAYVLYASFGQMSSFSYYISNLLLIFSPKVFFLRIMEINATGLWSAFGLQFRGNALTLVWFFETLLIIVIPIIYIWKTKVFPYSENFEKWYPKYTLDENFKYIVGSKELLTILQKDVVNSIGLLGFGAANRFSKVHLFYLENEQSQYINIESITLDKEGNKDSETLIENFKIDNKTAKAILATFEHKKEKIEVF